MVLPSDAATAGESFRLSEAPATAMSISPLACTSKPPRVGRKPKAVTFQSLGVEGDPAAVEAATRMRVIEGPEQALPDPVRLHPEQRRILRRRVHRIRVELAAALDGEPFHVERALPLEPRVAHEGAVLCRVGRVRVVAGADADAVRRETRDRRVLELHEEFDGIARDAEPGLEAVAQEVVVVVTRRRVVRAARTSPRTRRGGGSSLRGGSSIRRDLPSRASGSRTGPAAAAAGDWAPAPAGGRWAARSTATKMTRSFVTEFPPPSRVSAYRPLPIPIVRPRPAGRHDRAHVEMRSRPDLDDSSRST